MSESFEHPNLGRLTRGAPAHVQDALDALRSAGWVEVNDAAALAGLCLTDLVEMHDAGDLRWTKVRGWHTGGLPREVTLVRLTDITVPRPTRPVRLGAEHGGHAGASRLACLSGQSSRLR